MMHTQNERESLKNTDAVAGRASSLGNNLSSLGCRILLVPLPPRKRNQVYQTGAHNMAMERAKEEVLTSNNKVNEEGSYNVRGRKSFPLSHATGTVVRWVVLIHQLGDSGGLSVSLFRPTFLGKLYCIHTYVLYLSFVRCLGWEIRAEKTSKGRRWFFSLSSFVQRTLRKKGRNERQAR